MVKIGILPFRMLVRALIVREIESAIIPDRGIGTETEGLYCFYCATQNFQRKSPKMGTMR